MIRLRDYQEQLVGGARSAIERGISRLLVQSPAGSGKTVTSSFMVKGAYDRGMRAMFVVHREELAKQASKKAAEGVVLGTEHSGDVFPEDGGWLPSCSRSSCVQFICDFAEGEGEVPPGVVQAAAQAGDGKGLAGSSPAENVGCLNLSGPDHAG